MALRDWVGLQDLAEAAVEHPDDTFRMALFPVVSETTLRQLVKEAKASEQIFQQQVRKVIRGSYSNHYRRMLPRLLETLQFRCSSSAYRPVMEALELLGRHVDTPGQQRFYPPDEHVPFDGVVPDEWRQAVVDEHGKVERIPYELCVLRALRDALRRREIHVAGAQRWRNPDEDLPADFEGGLHGSVHHVVRVACWAAGNERWCVVERGFGLSAVEQERVWELWGAGKSMGGVAEVVRSLVEV